MSYFAHSAPIAFATAAALVCLSGCDDTSSTGAGTAGGSTAASGGNGSVLGGGAAVSGGGGSVSSGGTVSSGGGAAASGGGAASSAGGTRAGAGGQANGGGGVTGGGGPTGLGLHPADGGPLTVGGTMTFTNVGAPGWWPRRLNRDPSDPTCTVKSGTDTWGGQCCLTKHSTESTRLAPFDEEMTLLLKAVRIRQLAVYGPVAAPSDSSWNLISSWDDRDGVSRNLWATQSGNGSTAFLGDFTHDDCVWYVSQTPAFDCGDGRDYYCPNDPGIKHLGWSGSKLVVMLTSMVFDDAGVKACGGSGAGHPAPWIAFVSSELTRDGGRKWNGLCNCYSKTGTVGDGCGEINLFEVVMDNNAYSNREFISTGVRSFQAGHVGGSVCGSGCSRGAFPAAQDVVDACGKAGYSQGPTLAVGGETSGCPVWVRPNGDRYLLALLDGERRVMQVAMLHPAAVPAALGELVPSLPGAIGRATIDALADLRLPASQ